MFYTKWYPLASTLFSSRTVRQSFTPALGINAETGKPDRVAKAEIGCVLL